MCIQEVHYNYVQEMIKENLKKYVPDQKILLRFLC